MTKSTDLSNKLCEKGICISLSEAKRLISQGAVKVDGQKADHNTSIKDACQIQVGKQTIYLKEKIAANTLCRKGDFIIFKSEKDSTLAVHVSKISAGITNEVWIKIDNTTNPITLHGEGTKEDLFEEVMGVISGEEI